MDASIRHILRHESSEAYQAELDALLRRSGFDAWCDDDSPRWVLGHAIWNATPLPSQGFRCRPLPEPKRNAPCPCGSGKKFKRCCQPRLEAVGADPLDTPAITHRAVGLLTPKQRQAEAVYLLGEAYRALPKVLDYLIAQQRKRPKLNPHGVTIGGPDQAWLYRQEMRATFAATPGLLEWLGQVKRRLPK